MSFLSGFLGNKASDSFVDQAVDKAAMVAKRKVKEKLTGKKQETDKTGGMGGVFPSSEDKKPKEKSGGLFGGLLKSETPQEPNKNTEEPAANDHAKDSSFNDALDDLALELN